MASLDTCWFGRLEMPDAVRCCIDSVCHQDNAPSRASIFSSCSGVRVKSSSSRLDWMCSFLLD